MASERIRWTGRFAGVGVGCAVIVASLLAGGASAQTASPTSGPTLGPTVGPAVSPTVLEVHLSGVVDPFAADYIDAAITDAASANDAAVLIEIDTPGGLDSSMRKITQSILNARLPVICYVAPQGARAASAGAFVLMSCPVAAMAPGTNVGAATPVGLSGAVGSDKAVNDAAAYMRSLAEQRGRNVAVAESFVLGAVSITAEQALQDNIIDAIAPNTDVLMTSISGTPVTLASGTTVTLDTLNASIVDQNMGAVASFLHRLFDPNLAFLFFWLGLALVVLELIFPGHVVSGLIGLTMLFIAVVSFGLLPVRLVGVALLVLSAVFFLLEARHPGLGAWGVVGLIALVAGGSLLFNGSGGVHVSPFVIATVAVAAAAFFGLLTAKALEIRHTPPPAGNERIVGAEGIALGAGLRPEGVVRVAAEQWRARTSGTPIPSGAKVRVTGIDGLVLTVEPLVEQHESTPTNRPGASSGAVAEGGLEG